MAHDSELTKALVEGNAEAALGELVRRHVDLVYATALRQVGRDAHLAEDVVQVVFARFVHRAAALRDRESLGGWFYTTAHHVAANVVRGERRRKDRELEAQTMENIRPTAELGTDWSRLQPVLDDAMHEINERDRDAIRLRYFERMPVAAIGARLGVTENAAAKRLERALEKLRVRLTRRGITSTGLALAAVLEGQASVTAPAGLAASVTSLVLTGAAAGTITAEWTIFTFMSTAKITFGLIGSAVVLGTGATLITAQARNTETALTDSIRRQGALNAKLSELENRLQKETERVRAAEEENNQLLESAQKMRTAGPVEVAADAEPITSELVSARFKRAQELVQNGDGETALRELLWCYHVGMPAVANWGPVRTTSLLIFGRLGERYPPALAVLREMRAKAHSRVEASATDRAALSEFATINKALKDEPANVAFLDQLPPGDRRRRTLASSSYDYLVANRRYSEAAEGRPYAMISSMFERNLEERPLPAGVPNPAEVRRESRNFTIANTAQDIEMLAGSGDLDNARSLAARLLAFDDSESTRALIQRHASRAGHPKLLPQLDRP